MTKRGGWPASGFGERLRILREERGLSQFQLAIAAECRVETISRLERQEQEPAWPLVRALARALGVSCQAFEEGAAEAEASLAKKKRKRKGE
jgi:transcriptional regulator with XRE-family HTH domain